jgi:hypothetical protein
LRTAATCRRMPSLGVSSLDSRPLFGAASFFWDLFYRTAADGKSGESRFDAPLLITFYVGNADPFLA